MLGHPYTDEEIAAAPGQVANISEMDALISYLQVLGTMWEGQ
jgi:cytochrome c oxidase cbb3-type subunit 2